MIEIAPSEGYPKESDWSFSEIEKKDCSRASRLEQCGSGAEMIAALTDELDASIQKGQVRFSVDSAGNNFADNQRLIFQFKVSVELYDWFFNGRSGYRAQFWCSPSIGEAFNLQLISNLKGRVLGQLNRRTAVPRVFVCTNGDSREEHCDGSSDIDDRFAALSLNPEFAKIWLCEWLSLRNENGPSINLGFAVMSDAVRSLPRLTIPRWRDAENPITGEVGEGTRAPFPSEDHAWLDIKGAFIDSSDTPTQLKSSKKRSEALFNRGWT